MADRLRLAKRDVETARSVSNADRVYNIADNAMLQAARALMFAEGYGTAGGEGQHKTVVQFAESALGRSFEEEVRFFEKMPVKRNRTESDTEGIVSEVEARQAVEFAERFISIVENALGK